LFSLLASPEEEAKDDIFFFTRVRSLVFL
jgi:hypothetical protein